MGVYLRNGPEEKSHVRFRDIICKSSSVAHHFSNSNFSDMLLTMISLCLLSGLPSVRPDELDDHRDFQYNSLVDNRGLYNFAYDTGNDPDNAHSMHMEYKDQYGVVRGRYGYTDPRGKLRVVEYEAGPGGFKARGDVGPDLYPHANTPEKPPPLRMAGWDPQAVPIEEPLVTYYQQGDGGVTETEAYRDNTKGVISHVAIPTDDYVAPVTKSLVKSEPLQKKGEALTIHNIDVHPDDIRVTTGQQKRDLQSTSSRKLLELQAEHRDGSITVKTKNQPFRVVQHASETKGSVVVAHDHASESHHHHAAEVRKYPLRQTHDHDAEFVRKYPLRQTHDHDAEFIRKYPLRQTHDHDAEFIKTKYPLRQTHDHDAEFIKKYPLRQTHDHEAEFKKYPLRQTHDHYTEVRKSPGRVSHDHAAEKHVQHDHAAEIRAAKNTRAHDHPHDHGSEPLKVYYNDHHDTKPHEHLSRVYHNNHDRDHDHSDTHLYTDRRSSSVVYPLKPRLLRSRPGTPYSPASYYWS